jgi:adenylate cyclase
MFTDMVESTQLAQKDERSALRLIDEQDKLARAVVTGHHGRLVKSTGDGLLVEFPSALDAIECAVEFQRRILERNRPPGTIPLRVRVGIHLGDVQRRGGDILGDAVNVAARVESEAEAGGICISESVYGQVRNKVPYDLVPLGRRSLKGVAEPMELYRVVLSGGLGTRGEPRATGATVPRLAVLPLTNISPDPNDEYFADGLTEELIAVLSKIPGLRVIARTSVTPYKSSSKSVAQIGAELGVTSILEGSVRKAADQLRITLQLIDVPSQEHVWSEKFDRRFSDVFAIQTEVAESTARAIRVELSDHAREFIHRAPTDNLPAYELYLRAVLGSDRLDPEAFRSSVALLEEAIRMDPQFALAYAQLGHLLVQGAGDFLPHRDGFSRARPLVVRALELDPDLSEAHSARGDLAMQDEHDWKLAEAEFEKAIALNPSNGRARASYSTLLRVLGRYEEAERQLRAALETDPKWWVPRWLLVDGALERGEVALAEERARQWLDPDPFPALTHLAFAMKYAETGRRTDARRELELVDRPPGLLFRLGRALVLAELDEPEEARTLLSELTERPSHEFLSIDYFAALYAAVGETEKALRLIEATEKDGGSGLWLRHRIPAFDSIRDDPRFVAALESFKLPEEVTRKRDARQRQG